MKKLKLIILVPLLFGAFTSYAQTYKEKIQLRFEEYFSTLVSKDFKKSVEYLPEDFFKIVKKEQMIAVFEKTMNDPSMEFKFVDPKIIEIQYAKNIGEKYYSMLKYSNKIMIKFKPSDDEKPEDAKLKLNLAKLGLLKAFGEKNVKLEEHTGWFEIYSEKNVCAISPDGKTDWAFVVLETKQKPILERFLPKEITDKI